MFATARLLNVFILVAATLALLTAAVLSEESLDADARYVVFMRNDRSDEIGQQYALIAKNLVLQLSALHL